MALPPPAPELLARWREGDVAAGAALASRFTGWYRAVCFARLGAQRGRAVWSRACARFQAGVASVLPEQLYGWSHGILAEEVAREGTRARGPTSGTDDAGTAERAAMLLEVAMELPAAQRLLVHLAYTEAPASSVLAAERELGPWALLSARDALKAALVRAGRAAFATAGVEPDHAPLAAYEAGRTTPEEDSAVEAWLLDDPGACQDLVDMAPWALALRGGALARAVAVAPVAPATTPAAPASPDAPAIPQPIPVAPVPPSPAPDKRGGPRPLDLGSPEPEGVPPWTWALIVGGLAAGAVLWWVLRGG